MDMQSDLYTRQLPTDLESAISRELSGDEKLAWLGQPIASRMAWAMLPLTIFGLFFGGFAVFWMGGALWMGNAAGGPVGGLFALFGLPFFLVGLAMVLSPLWGYRAAIRTAYAVTDRRAIIFKGSWRGTLSIRSFEPARLGSINRIERTDGSGDLVFEETVSRDSEGSRHVSRVGFLAIDRVHEVHALLRLHVLKEG